MVYIEYNMNAYGCWCVGVKNYNFFFLVNAVPLVVLISYVYVSENMFLVFVFNNLLSFLLFKCLKS